MLRRDFCGYNGHSLSTFPGSVRAQTALCAAVLAVSAGRAQETGDVLVTSDPESREMIYSATTGSCRISWVLSNLEINRGVIRQRSRCSLPLPEQLPLISKVLGRVLGAAAGAAVPRTLYWGRLFPGEQQDYVMAMRLALAAKRSKLWDASRGRARTGNPNLVIRNLANDALIYGELRDLFNGHGLGLQLSRWKRC